MPKSTILERLTRIETKLDDGIIEDIRELKEDVKKFRASVQGVWWKVGGGVGFLILTEIVLKVIR